MRFTYDPRYNIAYIRFHEKTTEVETIRISDELIIDTAPDGTIYGIELLNANKQLQREDKREDKGKLSVINEATGEQTEVPLSIL
jgi:uncharacterized protein YuzE